MDGFPYALSLEFANTGAAQRTAGEPDRLPDFPALAAWLEGESAISAKAACGLLKWAKSEPGKAAHMLAHAVALREAVFQVMSAHAHGRTPRERELALVQKEIATALRWLALSRRDSSYEWRLVEDEASPEALCLAPVALSAAALLTSPDLPKLRVCANDECGWIFLDRSKNRSRKWCEMESCGNKMKARRHYARVRASKTN